MSRLGETLVLSGRWDVGGSLDRILNRWAKMETWPHVSITLDLELWNSN